MSSTFASFAAGAKPDGGREQVESEAADGHWRGGGESSRAGDQVFSFLESCFPLNFPFLSNKVANMTVLEGASKDAQSPSFTLLLLLLLETPINVSSRWWCAGTLEMQSPECSPSLTALSSTSSSASRREPGLGSAEARYPLWLLVHFHILYFHFSLLQKMPFCHTMSSFVAQCPVLLNPGAAGHRQQADCHSGNPG